MTSWCDLDAGEGARGAADFWQERVNEVERYLTPGNGTQVAVLFSRS